MKLRIVLKNTPFYKSSFVLILDEKPSNWNEHLQLCPLERREQGGSLDQGDLRGSSIHLLTLMRGLSQVGSGAGYMGSTDERGRRWLCLYGLSVSTGESRTELTEC